MSRTFFKAAGFCICALGASQLASAQDKIYLNDGNILDAKVKEINQRSIVYRRWDNQDGADYVLTRREVERIVYENGTEESFEQQSRRSFPPPPRRMERRRSEERGDRDADMNRPMNRAYGRNIIAIAGLQMTMESVAGVGVHYERILDKGGIISLYVPVAFSFYRDQATSFNSSMYPQTNYEANRVFTSVYPGLKFYPGGSGRRVSYSVGPSFALGFGTVYKEEQTYNSTRGTYTQRVTENSAFRAGFLVNNGINLQPTPHLYVGTEFGIGINYYDNSRQDYNVGDEPIIQFNFKVGYRF
jgi:hypothetical protein